MRDRLRSFCCTLALGLLLGGCQAATSEPPARPALPSGAGPALDRDIEPIEVAAKGVDWAAAGDCVARLRLLHSAAAAGRLDPEDPPPFVVVAPRLGSPRDWLEPEILPLAHDLPLAVVAGGAGAALGQRCVIELGPARGLEGERRVVAEETVRSAYQTGTRSERNPDYDVAQARVRQAEREARRKEAGLVRVGDPIIDLVGTMVESLIQGYKEHGGEQGLDEALDRLAATPRSIEHPVYRPYSFARTIVHARKTATVPVTLRDPAGRPLRTALLQQREVREHQVLEGLDPRDRDYEQHRAQGLSRSELERWLERPPELRLSDIVAGLLAEGAPPAASGPEPEALHREALRPGPQPRWSGGPLAESLVRIGEGSGVYVAPRLVLTALPLVGGGSVVDVTAGDGQTVPGLVAHRDPASGLALIHVPRTSSPLRLEDGAPGGQEAVRHDGRALRLPVALPEGFTGAAVVAGDALVGLIAGADGRSPVAAAVIQRFVVSREPGALDLARPPAAHPRLSAAAARTSQPAAARSPPITAPTRTGAGMPAAWRYIPPE
jgi:S1-C subfamily serine protease